MSKRHKKRQKSPVDVWWNSFVAEAELDFHHFGQLTDFDIEKILFEFLEDSYVSSKSNLLVITGKGPVVRPLVQKLLKQNKFVKNFNVAGYFNGQDGAFEVELRA